MERLDEANNGSFVILLGAAHPLLLSGRANTLDRGDIVVRANKRDRQIVHR